LLEVFATEGEEAFRKKFATAVLLHSPPPSDDEDEDEDEERAFRTSTMDWQEVREKMAQARATTTPSLPAARPLITRSEEQVLLVKKREGGIFRERVGLGRAANADVSIPLLALSKYHAYITVPDAPGAPHTLTDAGSTNGTWVNERRLAPKENALLESGAHVRLGPHSFTFLTAEGLLERVRRRASARSSARPPAR
jgi:hypothetical protein